MREDGGKETYWRYLADNVLMDERGVLNRELGGVDYGLKQLSQPLPSLKKSGDKAEKSAHRAVSFNPVSRFYTSDTDGYHLEGDRVVPLMNETTKSSATKLDSLNKPAKPSSITKKYSQFESAVKEDPQFSEKEYHKQKKQLLERYWTKKITVISDYQIPKAPRCASFETKETIRDRKNKAYWEAKKQEEDMELKKNFKAQDVPMSVKTPMLGTIEQAARERNMKNVVASKEKTLALQKPFSFYEKDKEKYHARTDEPPLIGEDFKFGFKAKELPSFYAQADVVAVNAVDQGPATRRGGKEEEGKGRT
jgi:hypothetical protein